MSEETLISAARALVANPSDWVQGASARDSNGLPCGALASRAVAFDLYGAMQRARVNEGLPLSTLHAVSREFEARIQSSFKSRDLDAWNDSITDHQELLDLMDQITMRARAAEGAALLVEFEE